MTYASSATQQHSTLYAASSRACSLALRSVHETKDNLILICIGLLEAIDRLQERLHLPCSLVKDIKRKLSKMVDRSLTRPLSSSTCTKLKQVDVVSDAIAESDMWDVAKPDEVQGLVHWLLAVTKSVNRLVIAGSLSVCRGVLILIMKFPGISTACTLLYRIVQLVDDTLGLTASDSYETSSSASRSRSHHHHLHHRSSSQPRLESYMDDPSLTAVVLEYREKECMVPMNINRRIQRVMHFQIPLRSFEATVRLPPDNIALLHRSDSSSAPHDDDAPSLTAAYVSSSSPRSIPVSPIARKRVQLAFSNFSDDVLYQARDRLRQERAATLTGARDLRVPRFNVQDCNEEIYLSCGKHCATKVGPGMYRSVRATVPIPKHRYTYFEMTLNQPKALFRHPSRANRSALLESASSRSRVAGAADDLAGSSPGHAGDPSVCIGLSTRAMPLNTLVGASKYSIGFYSVGHVLIGSERRSFVSVDLGFGYEATVGVLVNVVDRADLLARDASLGLSDSNAATAEAPDAMMQGPPSLGAAPTNSSLALVRFSVNGVALRDDARRVLVFTLPFPSASELFPTLTLHSQDVQVLSRFSAADITALNVDDFELPHDRNDTATNDREDGEDKREADCSRRDSAGMWCLDGLRLGIPCS